MSQLIRTAKGLTGQLELYSDKVCIKRKGFSALILHGLKGDKDIRISSISSIQFKGAGMVANGFIEFAFMGGTEAKSGGLLRATRDENTVFFSKKQQEEFEYIKLKIEQILNKPAAHQAHTDDADQIAKLASLRDQGILSDAEFDAKKRQILGL